MLVLRYRVVEYYHARAFYALHLLNQLDVITRTSELARLFGIQFYDVLSRGSQVREREREYQRDSGERKRERGRGREEK